MLARLSHYGLAAALALGGLTGCAVVLTNYTASDMRQPENLRTTVQLDQSLPEVYKAITAYEMDCRPIGNVAMDPSGTRLVVTQLGMGRSDSSVYLLADITPKGTGAELKGYTYYSTWQSRLDVIVGAIRDPKHCA